MWDGGAGGSLERRGGDDLIRLAGRAADETLDEDQDIVARWVRGEDLWEWLVVRTAFRYLVYLDVDVSGDRVRQAAENALREYLGERGSQRVAAPGGGLPEAGGFSAWESLRSRIAPSLNAVSAGIIQIMSRLSRVVAELAHSSRNGTMISCPSCGTLTRPQAKFCGQCGCRLVGQRENGRLQSRDLFLIEEQRRLLALRRSRYAMPRRPITPPSLNVYF